MAVVIAVMWVAARLLKGRQMPGTGGMVARTGRGKKTALVQIIGRQGVGKGASVSVMRVGDRTLVVGITDHNVTLLTELDDVVLDAAVRQQEPEPHWTGAPNDVPANIAASSPARKGLLTQVREMTVRRG